MRETFPEKQVGDQLSASHLNRISAVCRRVSSLVPGSYTSSRDGATTIDPPFSQSPVIINTIVDADAGSYTIFLRYYNHADSVWITNEDTEYELDVSETSETFIVGEKLVAMWQPQRDKFIPASAPSTGGTIVIQTPVGGIPARVGTKVGSAVCATFLIDDDDELIDLENAIVVKNISGVKVLGEVYGVASKEQGSKRWVVVVESCGP